MIDVDNFKLWNDTYGHDTGDEILRRFADVLTESVRANDIVARYGGEEFVLLLPNSDEQDAMVLCERVLAAIHSAGWPRGPVTASLGCASLHSAVSHGTRLVTQADEALYTAKRSGKDRVVHWTSLEPRELALGA
jgi:diguanylate cyclase (GGDEF)-like protein